MLQVSTKFLQVLFLVSSSFTNYSSWANKRTTEVLSSNGVVVGRLKEVVDILVQLNVIPYLMNDNFNPCSTERFRIWKRCNTLLPRRLLHGDHKVSPGIGPICCMCAGREDFYVVFSEFYSSLCVPGYGSILYFVLATRNSQYLLNRTIVIVLLEGCKL